MACARRPFPAIRTSGFWTAPEGTAALGSKPADIGTLRATAPPGSAGASRGYPLSASHSTSDGKRTAMDGRRAARYAASVLAVETDLLAKTYPRSLGGEPVTALAGVSLRVEQGTAFGLIGPNGAGKTTFIKLLLGIAQPSGGRVRLFGG